jgi:outer membrane autotransporter protein
MLHTTQANLGHKISYLAVLSALNLITAQAHAACTGSIANPTSAAITVLCTGASADLSNGAGTALVDTTTTSTAGNNTLIQMNGEGRTLNNTGDIINNRVITGTTGARGRTAILIGAATLNASGSTLFTAPNTPSAGATTVTLNAAAPAAYVGQTLVFGRFDAAQGDFPAGEARVITAVSGNTVTFATPLTANYAGSGTDPIGYKVVDNFGGGNNIVNNSGTISAQITSAEITQSRVGNTSVSHTAAVKGITASVEGVYVINNKASGKISASSAGIGSAIAVEAGGAVTDMTVNNDGLILAARTAPITLANNFATSLTATSGTFSAQTLAQVNAFNSQEELESNTINNSKTGVIRAEGAYAAAIYMRAEEQAIVNDGLIEHVAGTPGFAIGSVSDGGEIRTLELENNGTINGDILAVNGQAQRWHALSTEGVLDERLLINSQWGQLDSTIENSGVINGSLYFSNGTHILTNNEGGRIIGNIDLDQRDTVCGASPARTGSPNVAAFAGCNTSSAGVNTIGGTAGVASNWTVKGYKDFTFENTGDFQGNITIRTANGSKATLIPTVTGSGAGSSFSAPSSNIAGMGNVLTIDSAAGSGSVTVAPKSVVSVKAGEYFLAANSLIGATPLVDNTNAPLVNWSIGQNASGQLVIGVDSLNSASTIAGISSNNARVLDTLLSSNSSSLGGQIQNVTFSTEELNELATQLRPEANNASMQSAIAATNQISQLVANHQADSRVASYFDSSNYVRLASNADTPIPANNHLEDAGFWLQGFGFLGDQNKRNGIAGYNADTAGFAAGMDKRFNNGQYLLGAGFGYATTNIDADGSGTNTDIDSYQASLYGSWNAGTWYLDTELGYARHQFDTTRVINLANATLNSDHDANQYSLRITAGYPMQIGNAHVTPIASLAYVHLDQDGYTEKDESGSGAALTVRDAQIDSVRTSIGAKVSLPLNGPNHTGPIKTTLNTRALWNHEFADTNQDTAARFAGGTTFKTNGAEQARDSANLGLSLNMAGNNHQQLNISYDAEVRSAYVGHTGSVTFRYDF